MYLDRPLREMNSRYRRQRARLVPNRYVPGLHYAGAPGGELVERVSSPGRTREEYDPIHPAYLTVPGYDPPEPWDAIQLEPQTPELRFAPPASEPRPRPVRYEDLPLDPVLFEQAIDELGSRSRPTDKPEPILIDNDVRFNPPSMGTGGLSDEIAMAVPSTDMVPSNPIPSPLTAEMDTPEALPQFAAELLEPSSTLDPELDAFAMMEAAQEAMLEEQASMPGSEAACLDDLVQQLDSGPMMQDPMELDPFKAMDDMFNQQMQMMDPFNMMGPLG